MKWPETPLTVTWDSAVWGPEHSGSIRAALSSFPCGLFTEYSYEQPVLNVLIVQNDPNRKICGKFEPMDEDTAAARMYRCDEMYAEVVTRREAPKEWDPEKSRLIFFHELGHVAGLQHDRYYSPKEYFVSVMTPNVGAHTGRLFFKPELTPADKFAIKSRYCP